MTRPGVYVSEAALPRVVANVDPTATMGAFLGSASRGPTEPAYIRSWSEFTRIFGGFDGSYSLPVALYQFFANGGSDAYVSRVYAAASSAAAAGTHDDLTLTAKSVGTWGNGLSFDVDADVNSGFFDLSVRDTIRGVEVVVERFRDLNLDPDSPRFVENVVNSTTIGSNYVTATAVADGSMTDVVGQALSGGLDGTAPQAGDYTAAVAGFDPIDANFVFNVPGEPADTVTGVITAVEARGDSVVVVDTAENQTPAQVLGSTLPDSGYAAVYYPWIYIADPAPDAIRGGSRKVPPGASVVGMILRTDSNRGVFKAPAGIGAALAGAINTETRIDNADQDSLSAASINVIRPVTGSGITVMGGRTRSSGLKTDRYLSVRRTINYVKKMAQHTSEFALFEPNTPSLWEQLRVANGAFLSELWQAGGLAGREFSDAFYVKVDEENNTAASVANGEVNVEIGIAPVYPTEFVIIRVGQFEADASTVVTEEV